MKAINDTLSELHYKKGRYCSLPKPQLDQLPAESTRMVWLQLPIPLLQMLGLRLYAWSDLIVSIVDHLRNLMLIGKTSVTGKQGGGGEYRNDWDLGVADEDTPAYNGVRQYLKRK